MPQRGKEAPTFSSRGCSRGCDSARLAEGVCEAQVVGWLVSKSLPFGRVPASMAGAGPSPLRLVPVHDASCVGANRRKREPSARRIAVHGYLLAFGGNDRALPWRNLLCGI